MFMMTRQQGIGLVEVMVALLLLAVAVLGFSTMQMTGVKATEESVMRTRAMSVIRGGSDMMRANQSQIPAFATALNSGATATDDNCLATGDSSTCTPTQLAQRDAGLLYKYATDNDINLQLHDCPGTSGTRKCFVASWGDTEPVMSSDSKACADENGVYKSGVQCFIMEAY